ncbi:archaeosine tRNA-ribosyltransferase [Methanobrevibacter filiformis]|uniref:Queuine tRNA-ribosyltransferase n=1 Tax=Methanobrevibacter filiformis TaxID=55758 RepID=A0A166A9R2_9EURY|nr:archaeosine tRNA-ribosyltransferase [Methanobrevibacter filiformis]KZX11759.1 queuine tRNA-ribosyltransferase [Methanobrevibacter filiformis]
MKKFEIKIHNGPGRLGKLEDIETPNIALITSSEIAKDEPAPYDIQKEIATWSVRSTIKKAKDDVREIGVIQGGKYLDLRVESAKELEKIGYNGFLIANGDDLLLHPKDLVDIVINLRQNISPNNYLIFPFAEPSFIPLLCYMGIDGFLNKSAEYYAHLNVLMTATKNYDLNEYKIYDLSYKELKISNENTLDFVLREVREHMKNGTLRNLVEERSLTSPQNVSTLKLLDKKYQDYLQKYTELY